ncbi:unnamed protein product, partial [Leptidea sinapis]
MYNCIINNIIFYRNVKVPRVTTPDQLQLEIWTPVLLKELRSLRLYDAGKVDLASCRKCNDGSPSAALYAALLNEHNRIAGELYTLNPFWEDNALFLETRRAVAAVGMAKAELKLQSLGFWRGYSSAIRAGTYAEILSVAPIFDAMINQKLVSSFLKIII